MATLNPKSKGAFGETKVREYLISKGYTIVACNYTSRYGEIDIIAKDSEYIVFTEVKTKAAGTMYTPAMAVTKSKQVKISKTATIFMQDYSEALQPRFDVAEVIIKGEYPYSLVEINYFDNAFDYSIG
ncbi:MAG: YraN family protein [Oscillospiraceae bacterium]